MILLLGSLVTLHGLRAPDWSGWLLAAVLLLLIRPVAVFVSFISSPLTWRERMFLAWFGVRGVGTINYAAIAVGAGALTQTEENQLFWTAAITVLCSIVVHGITGSPAGGRLEEEHLPNIAADRQPSR